MAKLTLPQGLALSDLARVEKAPAYQLAVPVVVFRRLLRMGFAESTGGSGQNSVWRITPAGRAALREDGNG